MSKIKDQMLDDKLFAEKEFFETNNPPPYRFIDEKGEHLHTYENKPLIGTSSVSKVIGNASPLMWWAVGLACEKFGWTHKGNKIKGWAKKEERLAAAEAMREKIEYMGTEDYLDLIDEAYGAHATKLKSSAKKGTDLHAELERYVKWFMLYKQTEQSLEVLREMFDEQNFDARITPFIEWAEYNVRRFLWSEGHCFSTRLWVGGISDCGYEKADGTYGIMDFKSSKEAYLTQFWQCAGYDIQISENGVYDAKGNKIFTLDKPITEYSVLPFGMPNPAPQFNVDIKGGREAFEAEVLLYKKLN